MFLNNFDQNNRFFKLLESGGVLPVCDGRFVSISVSRDVSVHVSQSSSHGLTNVTQLIPRHYICLQVVRERSLQTDTRCKGSVTALHQPTAHTENTLIPRKDKKNVTQQ